MTATRIPRATYRIQFNRDFRFEHAAGLVPYLDRLGIGDVYASPIFKSRPGSAHGYDITDPLAVNPELGGAPGFDALAARLQSAGMGLLLDIVPNHMAASGENAWWMDLLEHGRRSRFANVFDVHWTRAGPGEDPSDRIVLPVLGRPRPEVLEAGELRAGLQDDRFVIRYYDRVFPIAAVDWARLLAEDRGASPGPEPPEGVRRLLERTARISGAGSERSRPCGAARALLRELLQAQGEDAAYIRARVAAINGEDGAPADRTALDGLLGVQAYELVYWRRASLEINYRRFFDIADLVGVRVEDPGVFDLTHGLALELVREGLVTGFRIDHVDGLKDPLGYLERLRSATKAASAGGEFYIVVEKILSEGESLPDPWPVQGTTGYEFGTVASKVFVDTGGLRELDRVCVGFTGDTQAFDELVYQQKKRMIGDLFLGEMTGLAEDLQALADAGGPGWSHAGEDLATALLELTACLPVYRTYVRDERVDARDREWLRAALAEARRRNPAIGEPAWSFLERVVYGDIPAGSGPELRWRWLDLVMRWQQMTGPVMAKGFEDTSLYRYARLISLNQVGGDPAPEPGSPGLRAFHDFCEIRSRRWPHALSATSTHDSKRGEDVRARLHVLSEIPRDWEEALSRWKRLNAPHKRRPGGRDVPSPPEEIFLYQTLLGAWPLDPADEGRFAERMREYTLKAAREAKLHTSWLHPDLDHEEALTGFVEAILDPERSAAFLADFRSFLERIAYPGALNGLAQLLLKVCAPGVPDTYRGAESWALTLVDPDNRRPLDFDKLQAALGHVLRETEEDRAAACARLHRGWRDGRIKLYVTARAHQIRREREDLVRSGSYLPLGIAGPRTGNVCAFARRKGTDWILCVVPVRISIDAASPEAVSRIWENTALRLPAGAPERWREIFTGAGLRAEAGGKLPAQDLFKGFPVALLVPV